MASLNPLTKGEATLLVPADDFFSVIRTLPEGYSVVGSRASPEEGVIALRVQSDDIHGNKVILCPEIKDAGSMRMLTMRMVGKDG